MTTPPAGQSHSSTPANPTAGALLIATAPAPATDEAEALLWRPLRGRPVAAWALDALSGHPDLEPLEHGAAGLERPQIAAVVVVARAARALEAEALTSGLPAPAPPFLVIASEPDWRVSLAAGLAALPETCAWVIAHDAARPLLLRETLAAGYAAARAMDGVALAGEPITDTLKRVEDGRVVETLPRARLRRLAPPLVIRRDLLARALAQPGAVGLAGIALASGARVAVYTPSAASPAITSEADWPVVEAWLAARQDAARP
ncbi:MAG TPA: 2-C-methyl-D-erythritol 4-phosphate cytidylyltransferase [Ktedonobacterales bacterium]